MVRVGQEAVEYNAHSSTITYFESGNKRLMVAIDLTTGMANTSVKSIEGKPRVLGSTTQVYSEARDLIQASANQARRPILYEFYGFVSSMKLWAQDPEKGARVFDWDKIDPKYYRFILKATKTFYPAKV